MAFRFDSIHKRLQIKLIRIGLFALYLILVCVDRQVFIRVDSLNELFFGKELMKVVLGILFLANAALLLWSLGQREFVHDKYSPASEFHPELMELLPAKKSSSMAKVTIESTGEVITSNTDQQGRTSGSSASVMSDSSDSEMVENIGLETARDTAALELKTLTEAVPGQCLLIGPYKTALDRGRAGRQLQDMKIRFTENEDPQGRVLGYRVYQGPFSTSADVSRAKRRLEKQGVKDLYLMNDGPNIRFISLGFFSNQNSANVFMKNFAEFKVKSKLRLEYATHYWLKVSDVEAIDKLNGISAIPLQTGISKTIKACDES